MDRTIRFTLNGKPVSRPTDPERMLLWVLRTDLGLTGTKFGCGEGFCGACTVIVNGEAVRSCQTPLKDRRRQEGPDDRGPGARRDASPAPGGLHEARRPPMRLLHVGDDPHGLRAAPVEDPGPAREGYPGRPSRVTSAAAAPTTASSRPFKTRPPPFEEPEAHERRIATTNIRLENVQPDALSRRDFLKLTGGGILVLRRPRRGPLPQEGAQRRGRRADAIPTISTLSSGSARTAG